MTAIKKFPLAALALVMMFTAADAAAQCRTFTKKRCLPQLEDYVQNDNYNTAVLIPGDEAELELTFFGDRAYRLLVCGHPVLGDLTFQVLDSRGNGIYDSTDKDSDHFDFRVANRGHRDLAEFHAQRFKTNVNMGSRRAGYVRAKTDARQGERVHAVRAGHAKRTRLVRGRGKAAWPGHDEDAGELG